MSVPSRRNDYFSASCDTKSAPPRVPYWHYPTVLAISTRLCTHGRCRGEHATGVACDNGQASKQGVGRRRGRRLVPSSSTVNLCKVWIGPAEWASGSSALLVRVDLDYALAAGEARPPIPGVSDRAPPHSRWSARASCTHLPDLPAHTEYVFRNRCPVASGDADQLQWRSPYIGGLRFSWIGFKKAGTPSPYTVVTVMRTTRMCAVISLGVGMHATWQDIQTHQHGSPAYK